MKRELLDDVVVYANDFLNSLPDRHVGATVTRETLRSRFAVPLTDKGEDERDVIASLAKGAEGGIIASAGPRFFGYVIGGATPVSVAADWLTTAWDQNAGLYSASPVASVVEEVAREWVLELLDLPRDSGVGFVTGCQAANFAALAAARDGVLRKVGWDVEKDGLQGAPRIHVVTSAESHATIFRALRFLGLSQSAAIRVPADEQGRMKADALREALRDLDGPIIVCAQAGNVNSGAFDPLDEIAEIAHAKGAWLHVDGAFGLWARASRKLRHLAIGLEKADSWATDAHKWLNVPYDCGIVIVRDAATHRTAMGTSAAYLIQTEGAERDEVDWVPEFSRRARAFPLYAVIRNLGRDGIAAMIDRGCEQAVLIAELLGKEGDIEILNDVVLNQVLVRFVDDETTRRMVTAVQEEGTLWLSGTTWHGVAAMRVSFSNWMTTEEDVRRSAETIVRIYREIFAARSS